MPRVTAQAELMVAFAGYDPSNPDTIKLVAHALRHPEMGKLMDAVAELDLVATAEVDMQDEIESFDPDLQPPVNPELPEPDIEPVDDDQAAEQEQQDREDNDQLQERSYNTEIDQGLDNNEESPSESDAASPADEGITPGMDDQDQDASDLRPGKAGRRPKAGPIMEIETSTVAPSGLSTAAISNPDVASAIKRLVVR